MKKAYPILLSLAIALIGCTEDNSPTKATQKENGNEKEPVAVDYSAGRAMNKRLGKGINLGNSWDSQSWGKLDGGWGNPIEDNDFKIIKEAGFNSVRLPVRWNEDSDYETHGQPRPSEGGQRGHPTGYRPGARRGGELSPLHNPQ